MFSVVLSTTSSDSASIIELSSEISFLKGNGFSSVWNNKNFSESLKNSRTWELILDIDLDGIEDVAKAYTPVPGGVGPMTINTLILHTLISAEKAFN